jgi:hypothetical protein
VFKRRVAGNDAGYFSKHDVLLQSSIISEEFLEQLLNCTHSNKDLHLGVSNVKIKLSHLFRKSILSIRFLDSSSDVREHPLISGL